MISSISYLQKLILSRKNPNFFRIASIFCLW